MKGNDDVGGMGEGKGRGDGGVTIKLVNSL